MPFSRQTRAEILEQLLADIEVDLPEADVRLPYSDLAVTSQAVSVGLHSLSGYIAWAAKQIHPDTADEDILIRHGSWWKILQKPATAASGTATATGTTGGTIPALTPVLWNGLTYTVAAEVAVPAGSTAAVPLVAAEAGAAGNVPVGGKLRLSSPIGGVTTELITLAGLSGGADKESPEDLLARLLARMQTPPHGGSKADYKAWALEVPGVTRAWVRTVEDEPGHIRVLIYVVMDGKADTIIPTADEVATTQEHIDEVRPVTAEAMVAAPMPHPLNPTIRLDPATDAVKAAVAAELGDLLAREAEPGDGEGTGTILLSHLRAAISAAAGEYDNALIVPAADVVPGLGEIVTLGAITWEA